MRGPPTAAAWAWLAWAWLAGTERRLDQRGPDLPRDLTVTEIPGDVVSVARTVHHVVIFGDRRAHLKIGRCQRIEGHHIPLIARIVPSLHFRRVSNRCHARRDRTDTQ